MGVNWKEVSEALQGPRIESLQEEEKEVKYLKLDFSSKPWDRLELVHFTDLQVGSRNFMRARLEEYSDWTLSKDFRYVFLGGDLIDSATRISIGSPYENTKEPIYQVDEAVELLTPLAKAGRLVAYVGGNHERRTIPTFGDSGVLIAQRLQVPYSRGVQLIDVTFGEFGKGNPFQVALWHGGGRARTKGAIANVIYGFMQRHSAHVCFIGHLHQAMVIPDYQMVRKGGKIKLQKRFGVMSSSFQSYWNSYAEVAALNPFDVMMGRAIVERSGHFEVTIR